ncbi:MAG: signal peptidase I [Oleiphilus sp.]|nr:MAG: signal peptidase I [Oleiphilus sp.]
MIRLLEYKFRAVVAFWDKQRMVMLIKCLALSGAMLASVLVFKHYYLIGVNVYYETDLSCDSARLFLMENRQVNSVAYDDYLIFNKSPVEGLFKEERMFIKTVVGLPGDRVELMDNATLINGRLVADRSLSAKLRKIGLGEEYYSSKTFTIPEGHYFVLGKNLDYSFDSRYWGLVKHDDIVGRVVFSI